MRVGLLRRLLVAAVLLLVAGVASASVKAGGDGARVAVGTVGAPTEVAPLDRPPDADDAEAGPTTTVPSTTTTGSPRRAGTSTTAGPAEVPAVEHPTTPTTPPDDPNGPDLVHGRVIDEAGQPIPGICLRVIFPEDDRPGNITRTGPDGRYRIQGPFMGALVEVCGPTGSEFGYEHGPGIKRFDLPPGTVEDDLVLLEAAGVRGRVVDQQGNPVAGVAVALPNVEPLPAPTGPDGRFAILRAFRGTYGPWLHWRGGGPAQTPQQAAPIEVRAGQWNDVTIVVGPWVPW